MNLKNGGQQILLNIKKLNHSTSTSLLLRKTNINKNCENQQSIMQNTRIKSSKSTNKIVSMFFFFSELKQQISLNMKWMSQKGIMNDRQLIMGKIGQQIYRIFSLLININKRYLEKKILNNQQYFWSIYQQSTSKIMAKSTINRKVCTPPHRVPNFCLGSQVT